MKAEAVSLDILKAPGLAHGFFTRRGGVSTGVYDSLNGGVGSNDDPARVAENRRRMAEALGIAGDHLLVPFQIHSATALPVSAPFAADERPRCDGLVTATRGLGLGVTGADCGIVLFADRERQIIGAAHAGWKGALTGVLEATIVAMERIGAERTAITAALGPTIGPNSYEVGPEFFARFLDAAQDYAQFFRPSARAAHFLFDLPRFIGFRLRQAGIGAFADCGIDTYTDEARCFSYRRTTHRGEPDYGRLIAAIALV
ncbi:polyphenol oxidase family protein [uncultured Methylovirgula sp.]|uniref:polyphenol oxidase family protein n=1 Tax=uncultured Methylovirgula sp. TaxID=1285960 RepID=UPI0026070EE2|nr:polyphenol oxidase family protein [uncultured Methylovirgula sp.]